MNLSIQKYFPLYRSIIRVGIPIILGQLGIIVVGFTDNIMVGRYGTDSLAAASFVNNLFNLVFICGMGFSYGLTPLVGRYNGEKRNDRLVAILKNGLLANFFVGLLLSIAMVIVYFSMHRFGQPEELFPLIRPYFLIQLSSICVVMLFNGFKQFADGITDTQISMWVMLTANIINIVGNYLLIYGSFGFPELGLNGAGISTLISRVWMLVAFLFIFFKGKRYKAFVPYFKQAKIKIDDLTRLVKLGFPVSVMMGVESGSFSLCVIMMGWFGSAALAAHQVAGVITTLGFLIYYGVGAAVTICISTISASGSKAQVKDVAAAGYHIVLAETILFVAMLLVFRTKLSFIFTDSLEVNAILSTMLFAIILYQIGDGLQIVYANALRGIGDVKFMAYVAFLCHFMISLPLGYFAAFVLGWGAPGVWAGFPIGLSLMGILLYLRFKKITDITASEVVL